jgi:hypothetical protein
MKPLLRTLGVAALVVALMNASAGLCFCHRGPALPGESTESGGCCHGPETSKTKALTSPGSCCHIESADTAATPVAAVQLAPPATLAAGVSAALSAVEAIPSVARVLPGSSPPFFVLRV